METPRKVFSSQEIQKAEECLNDFDKRAEEVGRKLTDIDWLKVGQNDMFKIMARVEAINAALFILAGIGIGEAFDLLKYKDQINDLQMQTNIALQVCKTITHSATAAIGIKLFIKSVGYWLGYVQVGQAKFALKAHKFVAQQERKKEWDNKLDLPTD